MAHHSVALSDLFDAAFVLAHRVHRHQARKGTRVPYIAHVIGVTAIVLEYGGSETEAIAALLHDAIEDAPSDIGAAGVRKLIREDFGDEVLEIVKHCTDSDVQPKPPWRERKMQYLTALEHAPASALRVSAADKFHNVQSLIRDYRAHREALWDRFNPEAGKAGTLGYYRALAEIFKVRMPGALTEDLDRAVTTLVELTG